MGVPKPGDLLGGRVRLEQRLGSGGFSSVWRAVDVTRDALVAVKVLHEELSQDRLVRERFQQEAQILHTLEHPSIARGLARETFGDPPFFTLEYVRGEDLQVRLRRLSKSGRPVPLAGVNWVCAQVASALVDAHGHGVVHRDLKPANIMVNPPREAPFVKVLDFGAAKALDRRLDPTTIGRVVGSIPYLTPEQLLQSGVDGRTDQFALAVLVYELASLRRAWGVDADGAPLPFHLPLGTHNSQLDLMQRILRGPRPRLSGVRPEVPPGVDEVLTRAMAVRPADRFESVREFQAALQLALLDGAGARRRAAVEPTRTLNDIEDTKPMDTLRLDTPPPLTDTAPLPVAITARRAPPAAETEVRDLEATVEEGWSDGPKR